MPRTRISPTWFVAATAAFCTLGITLLISGCQANVNHDAAFTTALDTYYSNRPDCLFANPIKFPESTSARNNEEMQEFQALVAAGLLEPAGVRKVHARRGEREDEYKLTDIGRLDWTADQARIGYGNFCIGHPQVNAIESFSRVSGSSPIKYDVSYSDKVTLPAWAATPQVKQAFPAVTKDSSGQTAKATLVKSNNRWKVMNVTPPASTPMG